MNPFVFSDVYAIPILSPSHSINMLHRGYKVLNMENKKIYETRDVFFYENMFPFHKR